MPKAIVARQREQNPRDVYDDAHDLARTNPSALAKNVAKLARRKNQSDGQADAMAAGARELTGVAVGTLATLGASMIDGRVEADRDAMLAAWIDEGNAASEDCPVPWELEGVKDPATAFLGVPWLALPPLVFGGLYGLTKMMRPKVVGGRKTMPGFLESMMYYSSLFTLAYGFGTYIRGRSYCTRERAIGRGDVQISITPKAEAA
jgi:hypothetical protein